MTKRLGLTGSIGMGKSTAAEMFFEQGIPIWDADAAVHELYSYDADTITKMIALVPEAESKVGVDRAALRTAIMNDQTLLRKIEAIVHPAIAAHRQNFIEENVGFPLIVLDIPLLFELKLQDNFDAVAVVSTDADTQRQRVLARGSMSKDQFESILAKQVPDAEKRSKADYIIPSDTLDGMRKSVISIIEDLISSSQT